MNEPQKLRLGKKPPKADKRTLQLEKYIKKLPAPPPAVDHASRMPANIGWMCNDELGCCTFSAAGHMVQEWSLYAERGMMTIPDSTIRAAYLAMSPQDDGAYMLDVLKLWRNPGIGPDRIEAFAECSGPERLALAKLTIFYFGAAYMGLALPDKNTYGPWIDPHSSGPANRYNGHAIAAIAYDDAFQIFKVCTWGKIIDMSYSWFLSYCDECWAALNDLSCNPDSGTSPEGFDFEQLKEDLAHLGDPIIHPEPEPDPDPEPEPQPDPEPPPPPSSLKWVLIAFGILALTIAIFILGKC